MLNFIKSCWQEDKERRLVWLTVLFALGIGLYLGLPVEPSKWITLGIIEALIVLAIICRRRIQILKIIGCLAMIVAGFTVIQIKAIWFSTQSSVLPTEAFYFKGRIASIDTNYQGRLRFVFDGIEDFNGKFYTGKYRITQRPSSEQAFVGQCVEMIATISPLSSEAVIGGYQFDRKGYFEGIKGSGYAESRWFTTQCPQSAKPKNLVAKVSNFRQKIVQHIKQVLPPQEASVTSAIIAGEKGAVDEKLYEQYRNSGLAHFLSISGLHMSMIAGLMFFMVRFLMVLIPTMALRFDSKKIAAVFAIIISAVYLLVSGMAVPAQRAFIMTFVVLLGVLTDRRAISMQTISLAAFLVLLISPEVLVSASFQMSFAAVLGLIAFYEKLAGKIQSFLNVGGLNRILRVIVLYVLGVVVSDFIASLMTMPFAVYHFNMLAVYTTLGNFLAGPIIGLIIMPFVLFSLLLMPLGLDVPALKIVGWGINMVNNITSWVSSLPYAGYHVSSMPHWGLVMIVLGGLWLIIWTCRWRYIGCLVAFLGFISIFTTQTPDILIGAQGKAVAFKNSEGKLEFVSSRGGRFVKNIWRNKYPVSQQQTKLIDHPDVKINQEKVLIDGQNYDLSQVIGIVAYKKASGFDVKTIRDDIGYRYWNR